MNIKKREKKLLRALQSNMTAAVIPIALESVDELVYKHDPHTREESQLNRVIEDYLFEQVERVSRRAPISIILRFKTRSENDESVAKKIIRNNFARVVSAEMLAKKREARKWRFNLCAGLLFLSVCLALNHLLAAQAQTPFVGFLKESFGIIGWVAIWEPVSYFLYGWREGIDRINNAIRLKHAEISAE